MKAIFFGFYLIFLFNNSLSCQTCIDSIFITYEPFELHYRIPTSKEQFELRNFTDTISDQVVIEKIIGKYQNVIINSNNRVKTFDEGFKLLCRVRSNKTELFRFYYTGAKKLFTDGYYFVNDLGLLQDLLDVMKSDNRFFERYKKKKE